MARPRQWSDEEILDAARTCFLEHGAAVSVKFIADTLGMSQAAIFKRFATKEELLVAAMAPPARLPWMDHVEHGPDERPIPDQLVELGLVIGRFFEELVPRMMILVGAGYSPMELLRRHDVPPPIRAQVALTRWFRAAMAAGRIREADPSVLGAAYLGALHVRAFQRKVVGLAGPAHADLTSEDLEVHVRGVVDLLWTGLAPKESA